MNPREIEATKSFLSNVIVFGTGIMVGLIFLKYVMK